MKFNKNQYEHIFALGKDGRSEVEHDGADPDFKRQLPAVMQALRSQLEQDPDGKKEVLLYFHGGMNGVAAGCKNATWQLNRMEAARTGTVPDPEAQFYPIFINWDSGPFSSWRFGLFRTIRGKVNRVPAFLTSPFRALGSFGRAVARTPETLFWQGARNVKEISTGVSVLGVPTDWEEQVSAIPDEARPSTFKRLLLAVVPGALRVATTPIADAWGVTAYGDMRRTAHLPFIREEGKKFDANLSVAEGNFDVGVLTELAHDLLELRGDYPSLRIKIAAHSMGAHIANELLRRFPALPVDRITFLAPACSIREFASTTLEFVKHSSEPGAPFPCEFYCVTLHPDRERSERMGYGIAPHGSLLVYIDEYLTAHHSVEEATMGAWNNLMQALPTLEIEDDVKELVHVKMLPWAGVERTHGAVDNIEFWKDAVLLGSDR